MRSHRLNGRIVLQQKSVVQSGRTAVQLLPGRLSGMIVHQLTLQMSGMTVRQRKLLRTMVQSGMIAGQRRPGLQSGKIVHQLKPGLQSGRTVHQLTRASGMTVVQLTLGVQSGTIAGQL